MSVAIPACIFKIDQAAFKATRNDWKNPSLKKLHAVVMALLLMVFIIFLFVAVAGY